jgi:hypothetical protein
MKKAIPQFLVYLLLLSIAGVFYYFSNQYADEILTINSSGGNYLPAPQHNSFGGEDLPAPKNSYGGEELPAPQANTFHVLIGAAFFSDSMIPVSIFHRILAILIVTSPIWIFTGYLFARKGSLIGIFKSKVDFYYSVVIFFFLLIGHSLLIDYAEMTYIYENVLTIELQFFEVLYKQILRNLFIQFFLIYYSLIIGQILAIVKVCFSHEARLKESRAQREKYTSFGLSLLIPECRRPWL